MKTIKSRGFVEDGGFTTVFIFGGIISHGSSAKGDNPTRAVADRHHDTVTKEVVKAIRALRTVCERTDDHIIRFAPPLVINESQIMEAAGIIRKTIEGM
jgi:adenosylmethionine-8-amino-7-oxononanoate aminotransferase